VKEKFTANRNEVSDLSAGWLLSHTMRRSGAENRIEKALKSHKATLFCVLALDRLAFNPCGHPRRRLFPGNGGGVRTKRVRRNCGSHDASLPSKQAKMPDGSYLRSWRANGFREANHSSSFRGDARHRTRNDEVLDCFVAEPVIGRAFARPVGSAQ
jgi:hypothetical protein